MSGMEAQGRTVTLVWIALMLATIASTWGVSGAAVGAGVGTTAVLLIAAFKLRLVLLHFMELRHAPLPLRLAFEAWVLVLSAALLSLYLQ